MKKIRIFLLSMMILSGASLVQAYTPNMSPAEQLAATADRNTAIQAQKPSDAVKTEALPAANAVVNKKDPKAPKARFLLLFEDEQYKYFMDLQSAQWQRRPYGKKERYLDVWVKLVEVPAEKEYKYPETYLLEHYCILPEQRKIQFLCELEVAGRPVNSIQQRSYDEAHWEGLVPDSVEEKVYQAVMDHKALLPEPKDKQDIRSLAGDCIDDVLHIGL